MDKAKWIYLVILRRELVQALLNDMIAIQVLDQDHDVQAQRDDDRMNLRVRSVVSLHHQPIHANARQSAAGPGCDDNDKNH